MPNHSSRTQPTRNRGALTADRIFNSTSPIINKDIQTFLAICITNWSLYTEREKKTIISKLPPSYHQFNLDEHGNLLCPVTSTFIAEDRVIKSNIATFQREVRDGYYTRTWQEKARKAMQERAEGRFDEYLRSHAQEMFGDAAEDYDEGVEDSDCDHGSREGRRQKRKEGKASKTGKKMAGERRNGRMATVDVEMEDGGI